MCNETTAANICRRGWNEANREIKTPLYADRGQSKRGVEERVDGEKPVVPVFFATDDNYLPFLAVTLESIKENSSKKYSYRFYVLHSGVSQNYREAIDRYSAPDFEVTFVDVTEPLKDIAAHLHMRDYYTCTTYFRVFIAGMFPQYDKAIYLDCDTVVLGDLAELYNYDLGGNMIAGAPCEGVNSTQVYKDYVSKVCGLDPDYYFNAGVLLMNLKGFREEGFYEQFADLLKKYKFQVIQDEDYLNVLCQDRVLRLPRVWNKFPIALDRPEREHLRIVHYGMTWKPWKYADIPYQEYFWEYAKKTEFYQMMLDSLKNHDEAGMQRDKDGENSLAALAQSEVDRPDGYFKVYGKRYGNVK